MAELLHHQEHYNIFKPFEVCIKSSISSISLIQFLHQPLDIAESFWRKKLLVNIQFGAWKVLLRLSINIYLHCFLPIINLHLVLNEMEISLKWTENWMVRMIVVNYCKNKSSGRWDLKNSRVMIKSICVTYWHKMVVFWLLLSNLFSLFSGRKSE